MHQFGVLSLTKDRECMIPHTHYLGSEVHLHLMHIDYAQVLMNYWDMLKATNVDTNNLPKFGRINHDDVGFYQSLIIHFCTFFYKLD